MSSVSLSPSSAVSQSFPNLPHYNTNEMRDLPADAAPEGVLENGDVYFNCYDMLTPNDISFLQQTTGRSFDATTVDSEQANGTFQNDPLAAAIGFDRANDAIDSANNTIGLGDLTGNITSGYLQSIQSAIENPLGDGTYEGFRITSSELTSAFTALCDETSSGGQANSSVSLSA
jgi:hypothetical protein